MAAVGGRIVEWLCAAAAAGRRWCVPALVVWCAAVVVMWVAILAGSLMVVAAVGVAAVVGEVMIRWLR